jgi:alpha-tubulin suppressor-like RCC1 family protein
MKKRNCNLLFLLLGLSLAFVPGLSYANAAISVGFTHTLVIKDNGTLWAWGENDEGQIGDGTPGAEGEFRITPVQVGADSDWTTVAAGSHHSLAIKLDGSLWSWGYNWYGQLGNEETLPGAQVLSPVQMGTDKDWLSVSARGHASIALKKDHTLWA